MKLYRGLFVFLAVFYVLSIYAQSNVILKGNCPEVNYVGRTEVQADGSVSFDWAGTYFRTILSGGALTLKVSDTGTNYYNVFVDSLLHQVVKVTGRDTLIQFVSGVSKKPHRIMIQKRSEGESGITTIHQFVLPRKGKLAVDKKKDRHIEIIGNSLTCGFGTEGKDKNEPFKIETENCNLSYATIIARYFDADYTLVAHSGQGIVRNYGDSVRVSAITMKDRMMNTFDSNLQKKWNFQSYRPDVVVINLGTNDFSTEPHPQKEEFIKAYKQMIHQLRTCYGDVPILCVSPTIQQREISLYLEEMCKELNDTKLYLTILPPGLYNNTTDLGSVWHPNYQGQMKMAMSLIPYISTITEWPLKKSNVIY